MLSDSGVVLDWAVTHQSDPFPCPYSTSPQWIRRPRAARAKDPLSTPSRTAVNTGDADTVDGEIAIGRIVPVPAKACTWAVQSLKGGGSCMPSSRLGSVPGPPEPLVEPPSPVRLVLCGTLWSVYKVFPTRLHPRQRRIGPEAVLKTWSSLSHLGHATSSLSLILAPSTICARSLAVEIVLMAPHPPRFLSHTSIEAHWLARWTRGSGKWVHSARAIL